METTIAAPKPSSSAETDFLPLEGTDYVEFYVGNAKQAAHFYKTAFGFQSLAYSGPETGQKDHVSYAIRQHKLTFVLTTPLRSGTPIADNITKRGGKSYMEPTTLKDADGEVVMSGIHTYGETVHLFIERQNYRGFFMPGFRKRESVY